MDRLSRACGHRRGVVPITHRPLFVADYAVVYALFVL